MQQIRVFLFTTLILSNAWAQHGSKLENAPRVTTDLHHAHPSPSSNHPDDSAEVDRSVVQKAVIQRERIDKLVLELESNEFSVRQNANDKLVVLLAATGLDHIQYLAAKQTGLSRDARTRIRKILKQQEFSGSEYTLRDGTGKQIPHAICEFLRLPKNEHRFTTVNATLIGRTMTNGSGEVAAPKRNNQEIAIKVFHPDYGTAGAVLPVSHTNIVLPIVSTDSSAAKRSVSGILQDERGMPLASLPIRARRLDIDSVGSYSIQGERVVAITDRLGRFRIYAEPAKPSQTVPIGARIHLVVDSEAVFPTHLICENDRPHILTIPQGHHFHRFEFQDVETTRLMYAQIFYRGADGKSQHVLLSRKYVTNGGKLLPGHYEAKLARTRFKPIKVTPNSPEVLVFKKQGNRTYTGRVLDGPTGMAVQNAIVFAFDGAISGKSLADMSDEQWQLLSETPTERIEEHPSYAALRKLKIIQAIGKSDRSGNFRITTKESNDAYGVIVARSGMLPYEVRALQVEASGDRQAKDPNDNHVSVGDTYLFPSARLKFQALLPMDMKPTTKELSLWPEWIIEETGQPDWFDRFVEAKKPRQGIPGFYPAFYHAKIGSVNELLIPANVALRLNLTSANTDRLAPIRIEEVFQLPAGAQQDLGQIKLEKTHAVAVHVVDAFGQPIAGAPVQHRYVDSSWRLATLTDEKGKATLHVAAGLQGQFGVLNSVGTTGFINGGNLKIPVKIDGPTKNVYSIRFSKEQTALLLLREP